jgi:hypothetical protein
MSSQVSLIYDYVGSDGTNIIKRWLDGLVPKAKAKLNSKLNALEQINRTEWYWPLTEVLKGDKDGLVAVRVKSFENIQYRMLGYDGPSRGEFTLLACGTEHSDNYLPANIGQIAFGRRIEVQANPQTRRIRHDFR